MFPLGTPSSTPIPGEFLSPDDIARNVLIDRELGGIDLNDPSEGLHTPWKLWIDGLDIRIATETNVHDQILFSTTIEATEVSLAFDQNAKSVVAFMEDGLCKLRWFDPTVSATVITDYPGAFTPFVSLDDKRDTQVSASDVIFAYIRSAKLYYRIQRDRYLVEHLLGDVLTTNARIVRMGMTDKLRFQIDIISLG